MYNEKSFNIIVKAFFVDNRHKTKYNNKANLNIQKRCCNFKFLETKLNQYILNQEKSE